MILQELIKYTDTIIGQKLILKPINEDIQNKLPFLLISNYGFYTTQLYEQKMVLMLVKDEIPNTAQLIKQMNTVQKITEKIAVLVAENISTVTRKKLVENKISFIIPGKQFFLAPLLISFQNINVANKTETLIPSAQLLILYHIMHREDDLEQYSFKELGEKFQYTPMGITKAVKNLLDLKLTEVLGSKEKRIVFNKNIPEFWKKTEHYLTNPVFKTVYTDEKPKNLLKTGYAALEEYTDMNPDNQTGFAIGRNDFYATEKNKDFTDQNNEYGMYFLQIWKYKPELLAKGITEKNNIDPLSLYLSMKDEFTDERTEMALDQIIKKYIW